MCKCFELISAALFLINLKYFLNDENMWHPCEIKFYLYIKLENTWDNGVTVVAKIILCRGRGLNSGLPSFSHLN